MDYAVIISAIVLGLSVLATAAKFFDWFIHTDPPTMIRVSRWMLLLLILAGVPVLAWMITDGRWSAAMLLGAGMLAGATFLKWRAMLQPLRALLEYFRPKARPFDMAMAPDPETVQRAAAVLEAYVQHAALPAPRQDGMSRAEALDVLGLAPGADEAAIRAAHRRLASLVHPDHSGSTYLMNKVDQARDTLLRPSREWPRLSNG
ncbi:MAG: hypothetical protein EPO55_22230 [Reyranella sp.]|uniref:hypothetical protein n=1 Tax=Reyranella sp. TaxID=1929291 RepID=UPI0012105A4D|nr:hypothetical protein [Reyranella sp.]TAJ36415.1 MAG: hypothetical protein EPO55_22230 [Reyranella sp.]